MTRNSTLHKKLVPQETPLGQRHLIKKMHSVKVVDVSSLTNMQVSKHVRTSGKRHKKEKCYLQKIKTHC